MYPLQRNENCTGLAQIARLGDAGELTRTEAAIKVEASLRQGTCGANPDTPERVGRSILMQASNPFECVAARGLWTPTGTSRSCVECGICSSYADRLRTIYEYNEQPKIYNLVISFTC